MKEKLPRFVARWPPLFAKEHKKSTKRAQKEHKKSTKRAQYNRIESQLSDLRPKSIAPTLQDEFALPGCLDRLGMKLRIPWPECAENLTNLSKIGTLRTAMRTSRSGAEVK